MSEPRDIATPARQQALKDFAFTVTAVWGQWTGGLLTEEDAMTAIRDAITELGDTPA